MADSIVKHLKHQFVQHWRYFLYIYLILNSHCHLPIEAGKWKNMSSLRNVTCVKPIRMAMNITVFWNVMLYFHYGKRYLIESHYLRNPNTLKFRLLMWPSNPATLQKICTLLRYVPDLDLVSAPWLSLWSVQVFRIGNNPAFSISLCVCVCVCG